LVLSGFLGPAFAVLGYALHTSGRIGPRCSLAPLVVSAGLLFGGPVLLEATHGRIGVDSSNHESGDGPWYRYLVDLLLVSPIILLLAIGALFRINRTKRPEWFLLLFIGGSYLIMCNLKYGMNLRYANMWDVPLRFLAVGTLASLAAPLRRSGLVFTLAIALICAVEMRQYLILFVQFPLYELVSEGLLRALHILK
jgi:hypothetical protein